MNTWKTVIITLVLVLAGASNAAYQEDFFTGEMAGKGLDGADQWGLAAIGLDNQLRRALAEDTSRSPVIVAVVDTGIDYMHEDLALDRLWRNADEEPNGIDDDGNGYVDDLIGWDFIEGDNDPWDWVGHGTHVAGIIAADVGNGEGMAGVDGHARIMVLRALNSAGRGFSTRVAEAIYYAVAQGARIVNLSMAVKDVSDHERQAINYARGQGVLVIVASGNAGDNASNYTPGAVPGAVTVAAVTREHARADFSNWGVVVDIAAPGHDILSLRAANTDFMLSTSESARPLQYAAGPRTRYYRANGTSFAAPFVTGVASLLWSKQPELTDIEVERMIKQSAVDVGVPGVDQYTGYGMLDAKAALDADPGFYIDAGITGISVVRVDGKPKVRVAGTAAADQLADAWIEVGQGEEPSTWKKASGTLSGDVQAGVLVDLDASHFAGAQQWTLRLIIKHKNGRSREARFLVNLG